MTPTQIAAKPADKRTPIEQAILKINLGITVLDTVKSVLPSASSTLVYLHDILKDLQALIPAEREQIERAYNACISGFAGSNDYEDAQDYFTQTYGQ